MYKMLLKIQYRWYFFKNKKKQLNKFKIDLHI